MSAIAGRCWFCGPYEVESLAEDPGAGDIMTPAQAGAIFSRHNSTDSHRGMVEMSARIDQVVHVPRFYPEEYA